MAALAFGDRPFIFFRCCLLFIRLFHKLKKHWLLKLNSAQRQDVIAGKLHP
jgi:hypothetical protein